MLHHLAIRTDTGPCVAYISPVTGGAVVLLEGCTEQRAHSEATRLNAEASAAAARRRAKPRTPYGRNYARRFPTEHDAGDAAD